MYFFGTPAELDGLAALDDPLPLAKGVPLPLAKGDPETPPDDDPLTQMHACDGEQATLVDR